MAIYTTHDQFMAEILPYMESVGSIACRAGCCHCCKELTWVSLYEWDNIEHHLRNDSALLKEILPRIDPVLDAWKSASSKLQMGIPSSREEIDTMAKKMIGVPCIFLNQNNLCSIYSIRPFICRSYTSSTPCIPNEPITINSFPWQEELICILFGQAGTEHLLSPMASLVERLKDLA